MQSQSPSKERHTSRKHSKGAHQEGFWQSLLCKQGILDCSYSEAAAAKISGSDSKSHDHSMLQKVSKLGIVTDQRWGFNLPAAVVQ